MQFYHIYLVFRKLMAEKEPNERLSQALNTIYQPVTNADTGNFFEMSSSIAIGIFYQHATEFNSKLNKEIQKLFYSEPHKILQQNNHTQLIAITSNNYEYIFITDNIGRITILITFYQLKNNSQNTLSLSRLLFESLPECYKFSEYSAPYRIFNTYEPFLQYAESVCRTPNQTLNPDFFRLAKDQITGQPIYHFKYIIFDDVAVLYNYNPITPTPF